MVLTAADRPPLCATPSAQRWHELRAPSARRERLARGGNAGALEEALMAIVAGTDPLNDPWCQAALRHEPPLVDALVVRRRRVGRLVHADVDRDPRTFRPRGRASPYRGGCACPAADRARPRSARRVSEAARPHVPAGSRPTGGSIPAAGVRAAQRSIGSGGHPRLVDAALDGAARRVDRS